MHTGLNMPLTRFTLTSKQNNFRTIFHSSIGQVDARLRPCCDDLYDRKMIADRSSSADITASILEILPTRVRRGYSGGALLEKWTGEGSGGDGSLPEDWIASTVQAVNPGLPAIPQEGLTRVRNSSGESVPLRELILSNPVYYLGEKHIAERGLELGFLAKLLDSAIRLHVQAHPTAAFAQSHLQSRYGKLETYVILAFRENCSPYLRLGFQRAPTPEEWRRMISEQDLAAMDACFDRIPLRVGEIWRVPGGMPHAIGEGVLMLEVMEPSDWVVRCEFTRGGITVPPAGRYMGRDLDFCLQIFDYHSYSVEEIQTKCRLRERFIRNTNDVVEEELVGAADTDCFSIRRLRVTGATTLAADNKRIRLVLISGGEGEVHCGKEKWSVRQSSRLLVPAQTPEVRLIPKIGTVMEVLICLPGNFGSALTI